MTKITTDEVKRLAELSRIALDDEQVVKYQKELENLLDYFEVLKSIDTENVKPTSQVTGLENVSRKDEVNQSLYGVSREELLKNAPDSIAGYVQVKRVLE